MSIRDDLKQGRCVRPKALAAHLNIPSSTVYAQIARGDIKVIRVKRCITIPPEEGLRITGEAA